MVRLIAVLAASVLSLSNVSVGASSLQDGENPAPVGATLKLPSDPAATGQSVGRDVAMIADGDVHLEDVAQKMLGTGKIGSVTQYNIASGPVPKLEQLQNHDAVLVWGGIRHWGGETSEALGNVLADYVDGGGGVVIATFSLGSNRGSWIPTGRFSDLKYWCLKPQYNQKDGQQSLGTRHQPDHQILDDVENLVIRQILDDVESFEGGRSSWRVNTSPVPGAELIADWTDGLPLIATRNLGFALRADLNL